MTRKEFMDTLAVKLSALSADERNSALRYYEEYFDECENEQAAIDALGSPAACAEQILKENGVASKPNIGFVYQNHNENIAGADSETKKKSSERFVIALLLGILTFPIWIAAFAVVFALIVAVIAINFALVVTSIACFVGAFIKVFSSVAAAGVMLGVSFIALGLVGLVTVPLARLFVKFIMWLARKVTGGLKSFMSGKEGA
ncbi:MAG: DUF1700 domain-containing protein [Oscillospiraceae bacterium]|nr:DUF1700 domain-containing protein [Oscillospiraceae bacterium]